MSSGGDVKKIVLDVRVEGFGSSEIEQLSIYLGLSSNKGFPWTRLNDS